MNNLKDFQQFNEELKYDTYISAGKKLRDRHPARAMNLVRHADKMKQKEYGEREYTLWPDIPAALKEIQSKDSGYGVDFKVTFKDLSRDKLYDHPFGSIITTDRTFEFYYGKKHDLRPDEKDFFYFRDSKDDFDGETTDYKLFSNRKDAVKFKRVFRQWLAENGYEEALGAFDKMSINTLFSTEGRWGKNHPLRQELKHRFPSYED